MILGRRMSLKPSTIADIRREMLLEGGIDSAIYALLDQWVSKVGKDEESLNYGELKTEGFQYRISVSYYSIAGPSKATFRQLLKHLKDENMNDICGQSIHVN